VGGSILISLTNAEVTQRSLFHQARLQNYMSSVDPNYLAYIRNMTSYLGRSLGPGGAQGAAAGQVYEQLNAQATTLGYIDVYWMIAIATGCMIPLAFLLDKNKPGASGETVAVH
jgi:DHA2 family multidrug resistance protein